MSYSVARMLFRHSSVLKYSLRKNIADLSLSQCVVVRKLSAGVSKGLNKHTALRKSPSDLQNIVSQNNPKFILFRGLDPLVTETGSSGGLKYSVKQFSVADLPDTIAESFNYTEGEPIFLGKDTADSRDVFALQLTDEHYKGIEKVASVPKFKFYLMMTDSFHLWSSARSLYFWHNYHIFCPMCGSKNFKSDGGYTLVCSNLQCKSHKVSEDHPISYPRSDCSILVLVTSVSEKGEPCCLLARKSSFPSGMVSCLAGFHEPGETLEECVLREVNEEVNLVVDMKKIVYHSSQFWPFPSTLMIGFEAACTIDTQSALAVDNELELARWFTLADIRSILAKQSADWWVPPKTALANRLIRGWSEKYN